MQGENHQKIKLLRLMEMLRRDTDENHPMTTEDICARLADSGISCDRRTVTHDVALLNEEGFEVMSKMCGHKKGYYIDDRSFSTAELKILIDAVQAASFVTKKKTDELTEKIAALAGSEKAAVLTGNVVRFNTKKHSNEAVFYTVDTLETALNESRKVSFLYYDLDENHKKAVRHDGQRYVVSPVSLVHMNGNYYLLTHNEEKDAIYSFRVDRMMDTRAEDEPISSAAAALTEQEISDFTAQIFDMYSGKPRKVCLEFPKKLMGTVYDRFGEETRIKKLGDDLYEAFVSVQISKNFFGWIFGFDGEIRISRPESIVSEYKEMLKREADRQVK